MIYPCIASDMIEEIQSNRRIGGPSRAYKAIVSGEQYFSLDCGVFLLDTKAQKCLGIAFPYEVHVTKNGTIVFFTLGATDMQNSLKNQIYQLLRSSMSFDHQAPRAAKSYAESARANTGTSTMDPSMTMSLGMDRSVEDIAEAQQYDGRRRNPGIADLLESMGRLDD